MYAYTDESGTPLYRKVRFEPKRFAFETPDGAGGWRIGKLGGIRQVPYRLHEIVSAASNALVLVPESEKSADLACEKGAALATCLKSIRSDNAHYFCGKRILIVPDHDTHGTQEARQKAAILKRAGAASVKVVDPHGLEPESTKGLDDWLEVGHSINELVRLAETEPEVAEDSTPHSGRRGELVTASQLAILPARWLWERLVPLGELSLLGGREGVGKGTLWSWLAARVTTGTLEGALSGEPRDVLLVTVEDSPEHTIGPRLIAAGANRSRVHFFQVRVNGGSVSPLSIPRDLPELVRRIRDVSAALVIVDPIISRIDERLDTHRDSESRQALEQFAASMQSTGASALGILHVNKSGNRDPLSSLMGSRAFAAVARSVLYVATSPETEDIRLLGHVKSNLGAKREGSLRFRIEGEKVGSVEGEDIWGSKLVWDGEDSRSVRQAVEAMEETEEARTALAEAEDWLKNSLGAHGGSALMRDVKTEAKEAGHSWRTIERAKRKLRIKSEKETGLNGLWRWTLPEEKPSPPESETAPPAPSQPGGLGGVASGCSGEKSIDGVVVGGCGDIESTAPTPPSPPTLQPGGSLPSRLAKYPSIRSEPTDLKTNRSPALPKKPYAAPTIRRLILPSGSRTDFSGPLCLECGGIAVAWRFYPREPSRVCALHDPQEIVTRRVAP